jgi:hypothetical protein
MPWNKPHLFGKVSRINSREPREFLQQYQYFLQKPKLKVHPAVSKPQQFGIHKQQQQPSDLPFEFQQAFIYVYEWQKKLISS